MQPQDLDPAETPVARPDGPAPVVAVRPAEVTSVGRIGGSGISDLYEPFEQGRDLVRPSDPGPADPADPADGPARARPRVRDRDVILVAAVVVAGVLAVNVVTGLFQPLDRFIALAPVIVIVLVAVTAWVLYRTARPARRG